MPSRRGRRLLVTWGALFLFTLGAIAYLRHGSRQFEPPTHIHGSVWGVHTPVSDFYGARTAGGKVLLFDSGADMEGHALDALLAALGARRDDVSDVFLTHGHGDHVGAAPLCTKARIHAGAADAAMIARQAPYVPTLVRFMGIILPAPALTVSDAIAGPRDIDVGNGAHVKALNMPGHTPGSTAYQWDGVLFVGDAMNWEKTKLTDAFAPFTVDRKLAHASVRTLPLETLRPIAAVCTGHAGCSPESAGEQPLDELRQVAP